MRIAAAEPAGHAVEGAAGARVAMLGEVEQVREAERGGAAVVSAGRRRWRPGSPSSRAPPQAQGGPLGVERNVAEFAGHVVDAVGQPAV